MKVFVRRVVPDQSTITLSDVDDSTRIIDVKAMVQREWDIVPECQRLIFAGRQLEDNTTLADCKIADECVVQLVEGLRRPLTKIFVKTFMGQKIPVEVNRSTTVLDVKRNLHSIVGHIPEDQSLVYDGRQLEDSKALAGCNIHDESTLHLVLATIRTKCPPKTIFVKTLTGQTIPVDVNRSTTVLDVKRKMNFTLGVVPEDQRLIYQGGS